MEKRESTVEVPSSLLDKLLVAEAVVSAHFQLCSPLSDPSNELQKHPGDPFGEVIAWLWSSGQHHRCVQTITDYLAEMRIHNPHRPEEGRRLIWDDLKTGLRNATSHRLDSNQINEMIAYVSDRVPRYFGESPTRLNTR